MIVCLYKLNLFSFLMKTFFFFKGLFIYFVFVAQSNSIMSIILKLNTTGIVFAEAFLYKTQNV